MMFNDNVVTTSRFVIMRLAIEVLDNFTGSNIYPKVREKICATTSKTHKNALFVQPKAESCDLCTRPFCVNANTSQVKICCNKTICDGCTWSIIRTANVDRQMQYPYCRTNFERLAEYLAVLSEKANFSEFGAAAMFELGGLYYYGNHGFPKDVEKGTKIWTYLSCSFNHQEACYRLAVHYCKIDPEGFNGRFHFEKAAIFEVQRQDLFLVVIHTILKSG